MGLWDTLKHGIEDVVESIIAPGQWVADIPKVGYEIAETEISHGGAAVIGWLKGDSPPNIGCELVTSKNCKDAFNFGPGSNPFNCYYTWKGNPIKKHDGSDGQLIPLKADCNTVAWLAALGLILGASIVGLMLTAVLLEIGFGIAPILEFFLQVIEYLTMGLRWVFGLWEWVFTQVIVVARVIADGTGVNVVLLLALGVEALIGLTLMLFHSTLRLYWSFTDTVWYSTFEWLNTPVRYVLDQWLMPNVGLFLTGVVEVVIFFPIELPILVVALVWGTIKKLAHWVTGEYDGLKNRVFPFQTLRPVGNL